MLRFGLFNRFLSDHPLLAFDRVDLLLIGLNDAGIARAKDVILFEGTVRDYAEEYIESTGLLAEVPESLRFYIDIDAFARDLRIGGDVTDIGGRQWVVQL